MISSCYEDKEIFIRYLCSLSEIEILDHTTSFGVLGCTTN